MFRLKIFGKETVSGFVAKGYAYQRFASMYVPYLVLAHPDGEDYVPLIGYVSMVFDGVFCPNCFKETSLVPGLNLCEDCASTDYGLWRKCVLFGAGAAFGECLGDSCPISFAKFCKREHVVYIASFGDVIKVGISALNRDGADNGFLYRLLDQGADNAVVISGGFKMWEAHHIEKEIADSYGLKTSVSFTTKLSSLSYDSISLRDLLYLAEEVATRYNGKIIWSGSFEWLTPSDFSNPTDELRGFVYGWKGNIIFLEQDGEIRPMNLKSVNNRGLICWEV